MMDCFMQPQFNISCMANVMLESANLTAEPISSFLSPPSPSDTQHQALTAKSGLDHNQDHHGTGGDYIYPSPITIYLIAALVMAYCIDSAIKTSIKGSKSPTTAKPITNNGPRHGIRPGGVPPPGSWVRPLGSMECFMAKSAHFGMLNTLQAIWIKSSEGPIKSTDFLHALHHVATKTQILQLCVQSHHTRPWFKRMRSISVDFQTEAGDVMEIYYKTLNEPYNMKEGPLWRARLVIQPGDETEAVLMIAVQHCLTDGNTNMILARDVMTTINASRTGQILKVPVRPIIPPIMDQLWSSKHTLFVAYTYVKKVIDTFVIGYDKKLTFKGVYRTPTTNESKVKNLHGELTEEQTRKLIQNCKKNGVTVHCCIYAALHAAYLKMAQKISSKKIDSAPMQASDAVNTRRYYDKSHFEDPGCHISMIENELLIKDTHITTEKGFWELAHQVSENLNYRLNVEMRPIKNGPLFRPAACLLYANALKSYFKGKQYSDQHFLTTNMGNLKDLLPANPGSGPLEITSLLRSVSMQYSGIPFLVAMHTFRGRFMYAIDYFTNKVEEDVAHQYFAIFSKFVNNIADVGSVE